MNKNYKPKTNVPSMHDVEPIGADKLIYIDTKTRKIYNRREICKMINNGKVLEGHIRKINGKEIPCKNPIQPRG